jgi:multiple sugar transport system permease protein
MTATTSARRQAPRRAGRKRRLSPGAAGPVFIAPFMALFLLLFIAPLGYAGYLSLYQHKLIGGTTFVGLQNYLDAVKDPLLIHGVLRVALFFVIQVPIMLVLALLFALALDSGLMRLERVVRLGIFVPYAVPSVVATLMWGYLYGRSFGPFAQLGRNLHVPVPDFLSRTWMLGSLANIVTWEFVGYNMIILYAALRTIAPELYEAAAVDGATVLQRFRHVTLPGIRNIVMIVLLLSTIWTFNDFAIIYILTKGGPGGATMVLPVLTYEIAFGAQRLGEAIAVALYMLPPLAFVIIVLSNYMRKGRTR